MEVYWNEDHSKYAVLVSPGYGADWSFEMPRLAYDKRIVEWYLRHEGDMEYWHLVKNLNSDENKNARRMFADWGYDFVYFGGIRSEGMVCWVPRDAYWRINEYDGSESLEILNKDNWNYIENIEKE